MAKSDNLMGLGMSYPLAARVGMNIQAVTIAGTSAGSATQLPGRQGIYYVLASNSGSGIKLPQVGGANGCLPGDEFTIVNNQGATLAVYAANNGLGSAVTLIGNGAATAGTTGVSLLTAHVAIYKNINVSTWAFVKTSV
jgi:hypothetical protein